jgi:hypothetical protein
MSTHDVERVAAALLYEGYMLYPYRPSSVKNRQRFNFGVVIPLGDDAGVMQTECLVRSATRATLDVTVRFLQLVPGTPLQRAVEREVRLERYDLPSATATAPFSWPPIEGMLEVSAAPCGDGVFRVRARVINLSSRARASRDEMLLHSLVSTHTILRISGGEFVSLIDPPEVLRDRAAACHNVLTWPVLAGEPGQHSTMLSSPIILYDYPEIAAESAGDLFDSTEIDEILSLRILTMTEAEQREMSHADERARLLLQRTQSLTADEFIKMHGAMRRPDAAR